jgi:two-component system OmpR family response regulator
MSLNLLLVEDDAQFATALAEELREFGHRVTVAIDGRGALQTVDTDQFDAVILDRMLPQIDGISVLQRLRDGNQTVPIIMLSALSNSAQKVTGLEAGADDYVGKPVPASELNARIYAVLRGRAWKAASADTLRAGDLLVSPSTFRAWRAGKAIDLSNLELNLLAELARNVDAVLTRAMLIERVWRYDFEPATNIVDVFIRRLRMKLMAHGGSDPIATIRGVGYMLRG